MEKVVKSSGTFMLTLTNEERKKLKLNAAEIGISMQNLIRQLIYTKKTIDDLKI